MYKKMYLVADAAAAFDTYGFISNSIYFSLQPQGRVAAGTRWAGPRDKEQR